MSTPPALTRHRGLLGTDPTVVLEPARGQGWNVGPSGHCKGTQLGLVRGQAREESNGAHSEGEEVTWGQSTAVPGATAMASGQGGGAHAVSITGPQRFRKPVLLTSWCRAGDTENPHLVPTPAGKIHSFIHSII